MNTSEREPWAIRLSAHRRLAIAIAVGIAIYCIGPTVVPIANRLLVTWIAASLTYLVLYWLTILHADADLTPSACDHVRSGRVCHLPARNECSVRKHRRDRLRDGRRQVAGLLAEGASRWAGNRRAFAFLDADPYGVHVPLCSPLLRAGVGMRGSGRGIEFPRSRSQPTSISLITPSSWA